MYVCNYSMSVLNNNMSNFLSLYMNKVKLPHIIFLITLYMCDYYFLQCHAQITSTENVSFTLKR